MRRLKPYTLKQVPSVEHKQTAWAYEEAGGISIYFSSTTTNLATRVGELSWRSIRAALRRKDKAKTTPA